jgi:hypothetical protein
MERTGMSGCEGKRDGAQRLRKWWSITKTIYWNVVTTPSARLRMLRDVFLIAHPPLLEEEGNKSYAALAAPLTKTAYILSLM